MTTRQDRLLTALSALHLYGTPARARIGLLERGIPPSQQHVGTLSHAEKAELEKLSAELFDVDIDVALLPNDGFPRALASLKLPPSMLFMKGNQALLGQPSVGMCGSRDVSPSGLEAARLCGREVARRGLTVVSGYARGVDTETHLAALEMNGNTIIVMAEGILKFRAKRVFEEGIPPERSLVVSQFHPSATWSVGNAMTRNAVIVGLSKALVVIEARETGGTFDAGKRALALGRPVLAIVFGESETPNGNRRLIHMGARPIPNTKTLIAELDTIGPPEGNVQPTLSI